jgi:hypothetical protein
MWWLRKIISTYYLGREGRCDTIETVLRDAKRLGVLVETFTWVFRRSCSFTLGLSHT